MRARSIVGLLGLVAIAGLFAVPAVAATTYYGPSFTTPVSISPGGTINIVLSTGSGTSFVALPQGSDTPCVGTCTYPNQNWSVSPTSCFVSVHQVTVTDPNNVQYMLGSSTTSGLNWPTSVGGSGLSGHAPAINYTSGDTFTVPFGTGAGGFSFTSVLGSSPPNTVSPEGPYYWWQGGTNLRLDQNTQINPTSIHGSYIVDIEGAVVCPTGSAPFSTALFFDAGSLVTTPEFPFSMAIVVATGFAGLLLVRKWALATPRV